MSYSANTWNTGDIITAEKLNALEQAVSSLSTIVEALQTSTEVLSTTASQNGNVLTVVNGEPAFVGIDSAQL